jgi:hypothetical protein
MILISAAAELSHSENRCTSFTNGISNLPDVSAGGKVHYAGGNMPQIIHSNG